MTSVDIRDIRCEKGDERIWSAGKAEEECVELEEECLRGRSGDGAAVLSLIEHPKKEKQEVTKKEKQPLTADPKRLIRGHVSAVCLLVRRKSFVLLVCVHAACARKRE